MEPQTTAADLKTGDLMAFRMDDIQFVGLVLHQKDGSATSDGLLLLGDGSLQYVNLSMEGECALVSIDQALDLVTSLVQQSNAMLPRHLQDTAYSMKLAKQIKKLKQRFERSQQ